MANTSFNKLICHSGTLSFFDGIFCRSLDDGINFGQSENTLNQKIIKSILWS